MTLQLEFYQFAMLLITVLGAVIGSVKVIWSRIEKNLDQNFNTIERQLSDVAKQAADGQKEVRALELKFLEFKAELPRVYVAREDYIRGQTVIEAKLDAVAAKLENVQIHQGVN
jgi:hypothetical protein